MVNPLKKKIDSLGVLDGKKVKKINPFYITFGIGSLFTLVATLFVLRISAQRQSEIASLTSSSSQSAQELKAREAFFTTRRAFLEKLSRTDYSPFLRTTINEEGESIKVGWRQLAAANWGQYIKSDLQKLRNTEKHPLYRMGETPALEVLKLETMDTLSEIAAGNTDFYVGYVRTDGVKVEQKLSPGGAAYLMLGKLEAIDLANSLQSIPEVNYSMMVNDISRVNESYVLAQRGLLQAQGYTDPVDELRNAARTRDEIKLLQDLNRQKLRELKSPPISKEMPEPRPVIRNKGGS